MKISVSSKPEFDLETTSPPRVVVGGLPTISITRTKLAQMMVDDCLIAREAGDDWLPKLVFSSNGQGIALAGRDKDFFQVMKQAQWIHGDGQSIVMASRLTGAPLPERVATTDFFHDAAQSAQEKGLSFFVFGGSEEQNLGATEAIRSLYPDLKIAGRRNGYFKPQDEADICREIRQSGADVLWVGLGKPKQEQWCVRNRDNLRGVGWVKTCGGLYAFLCGDAPRAPDWMQRICLEWLYRTWREPRRLGWRYLTTNPYSMYRLLAHTRRSPIAR